jgi:hypothetical protein
VFAYQANAFDAILPLCDHIHITHIFQQEREFVTGKLLIVDDYGG